MANAAMCCPFCRFLGDLYWAQVMREFRTLRDGLLCPRCKTPMLVRWVATGYRLPMPEQRPRHVCPACFPDAAAQLPMVRGIRS